MINLKEVASKLEELLNDVDNPVRINGKRVIFVVATEGYKLDSNYVREEGKNYIPVFVSLNGGENNPVPFFAQQSKAIEISVYFPLRYKNELYDLESYICGSFRGKILNYGNITGKCLSNIGVANYGEIIDADLDSFKDWTSNKYANIINVTEPYISMNILLSVQNIPNGYLYGNDAKFNLAIRYKNFNIASVSAYISYELRKCTRYSAGDITGYYAWKNSNNVYYTKVNPNTLSNKLDYLNGIVDKLYDELGQEVASIEEVEVATTNNFGTVNEDVVWSAGGTGANVSPVSQQLIGKPYATSVQNITNFNKSLNIYVNPTNDFGKLFFAFYNRQSLDLIDSITLTKEYSNGMKYKYTQLALNINENIAIGEPLTFTITLGDK